MKTLRPLALALALACAAVTLGHAQTPEPASEQAAAAFCDALDVGDLGQVWDQDLGPFYQATVPRQTFIGIIGVARIQAGGPHLSRTVVGEQAISQLPTGQTGGFYYVRFRTTFHTGVVFQDIYLQNLGGVWKVMSSLASPAPPA